ncbi:MAG: type I-C CRISPR-associated protein Cas8c/Csd1 [Anaerolineaceae bacterium]
MVLQALNNYYDLLASNPESGIALLGYSMTNVNYALVLSESGELKSIIPLIDRKQLGERIFENPIKLIVPEQTKRASNIKPNFLCDSSAYVLGFSEKDSEKPGYAVSRFNAFKEFNIGLLEKINNGNTKAVISFLNSYDPKIAKENPIILEYYDDLAKGKTLVFKLHDRKGFIHDDQEIKNIWEKYKTENANPFLSQCLVTGLVAPIARLHPSIKGVNGSNSVGATLVGFNAPAYESYNRIRGQGLNSPVSEKSAFAYTTVLNFLLSSENKNKKFSYGDTTVVYWAESTNSEYSDIFEALFEPDWRLSIETQTGDFPQMDKKAEHRIREIADKVKSGKAIDYKSAFVDLDPNTDFYVLGLSPNAARLSIRFFYKNPFKTFIENILLHYEDMKIVKEFEDQPDMISIKRIIDETVSKKSTIKSPLPLLSGSIFYAILENSQYPAALYYSIINRIRADVDDERKKIRKISYVKVAIIKAFLLRKFRNNSLDRIKEVLVMSLNEESTNQAYLLGRLFAVLEKAQQDAVNASSTIKDRYFTSACASPSRVFPVLLRLSQHHISKSDYGMKTEKDIEKIMNLLDVNNNPIPAHLTLDEQGIFILGYYHQRAAFFIKKDKPAIDNIFDKLN